MFIQFPDRWPKLGDIYQLENGIKCIFDYDDGLQFGVSQSDKVRWGNKYLMGVTEWLKENKAKLLGNDQNVLKVFEKNVITEDEWQVLNDFGIDDRVSRETDKVS